MAKDPKQTSENPDLAAVRAAGAAAAAAVDKSRDDDDEPAPREEAMNQPLEAHVKETGDEVICRPPPGIHTSRLGDVVIGNWIGQHDGKSVRVFHGTPIRGLPRALVEKIRKTPDQRIGVYPPPVAPLGS